MCGTSNGVYEYKCANCGRVSEFLEGVGEGEVEKECKYCGSKQLNRIPSITYTSSGRGISGSQGGKPLRRSVGEGGTCCGRDEPCEKPPCSDDGVCKPR